MILKAFDVKFHETKNELPPKACKPSKKLNKKQCRKRWNPKQSKKTMPEKDKWTPKQSNKNNVERVGSYTLIYLHILLYTFIYLHIPPNSFIYLHILPHT